MRDRTDATQHYFVALEAVLASRTLQLSHDLIAATDRRSEQRLPARRAPVQRVSRPIERNG